MKSLKEQITESLQVNESKEFKFKDENEFNEWFEKTDRADIKEINGVKFGELYPMLTVSNKHVYYYDVEKQSNKFLSKPFKVKTK